MRDILGIISVFVGSAALLYTCTARAEPYTSVPITVFAYDKETGKYLNPEGHKSYIKDGFKKTECKDKYDQHYWTDCMINHVFDEAEKDFNELGLKMSFNLTIKRTDFKKYDPSCKRSNCVFHATSMWNPYKFDVLFLPRSNQPVANTRRFEAWGQDYFVVGIGAGDAWTVPQVSNLVAHEVAHGMGVDFHSNGDRTWVFNAGKKWKGCQELKVMPYKFSGLKPDCEHRSHMGVHFPDASVKRCKYDYSFNVPYYGPVFREVFNCWLSRNGVKKEC